jgi:putative ABC transport system permease protein
MPSPALGLRRNVTLGVKNLLLHKLRSLLTMLGVVFGVSSVVAMLAIGEGASSEALEQIRQLGSHNILLASVKPAGEETVSDTATQDSFVEIYGLTWDDARRIRETVPSVRRLVPVKGQRQRARMNEVLVDVRVLGINPDWFDLVQRRQVAGRRLLQSDLEESSAVCVLTEPVARRLLAGEAPLGESIYVGDESFRVVGIVEGADGAGTVGTPDSLFDVYIPVTTFQQRLGDFTATDRVMVELSQILVEVDSLDRVEPTSEAIQTVLARFHADKDYEVSVPLTLLRQAERTKRRFNIVLGSIAGISLLVGGIGIMNIMLASVTERTREIGVRRAIGARRIQIVQQFLVETMVLSGVGGVIGISLGIAIPAVVTLLAGMPTVVTPSSLLLAAGVSMVVGLVFGIYPAYRAAGLDPIVALRHE